ncbi:MAG: hypothetical protein AAF631_07270 [Pseudomonadota bacterium]
MADIIDNPAPLFSLSDGAYRFARWGRPIAPVVFGVDDATLAPLKSAISQTVAITGTRIEETDPDTGANFMWFFCREWEELRHVPNLDKLFRDFEFTMSALEAEGAIRYRSFGFDPAGAIRLCVVFVRVDGATAELPIQTLAVGETFQSLLTWADSAFDRVSPIAKIASNNMVIVKPEFAAITRAAYDATMPDTASDRSHALRLSARARLLWDALDDA